MLGFQKVIDSKLQVALLLEVHSEQRVGKVTAATSLHLYENDGLVLSSDDVNITMTGMPVTLQDDVTLLPQVGGSQSLSPCPGMQMFRALRPLSLVIPAHGHPDPAIRKSPACPSLLVRHIGHHTLESSQNSLRLVALPLGQSLQEDVTGRPEHGQRGAGALVIRIDPADGDIGFL